jgi:hypothetical protein
VDIENERDTGAPRAAFEDSVAGPSDRLRLGIVTVMLVVYGSRPVTELAARLKEINGVLSVSAGDVNVSGE